MNEQPSVAPVAALPYSGVRRRWDNYVIALGLLAVVIGGIALLIGLFTLPRIFDEILPPAGRTPLRLLDFALTWVPIREALILLGGCALLCRSRFTWHLTIVYVATGLIRPIIWLILLPVALREARGVTSLSGVLMLHHYGTASAHAIALLAALLLLLHPFVRAVFDSWTGGSLDTHGQMR